MKNLSKPVKIAIIAAIAVILLAIIITILVVVNQKETLEVYDSSTGYKTTFKYPSRKGYKVENITENENTFKRAEFTNEVKNIKLELYYEETSNSLFERNQNLRKNDDNYKEYKFGDCFAYSYTSGEVLQANILLRKDDNERDLILYIYMDKFDFEKDADMNEIFNSAEMQKILNSIKFEQIKAE